MALFGIFKSREEKIDDIVNRYSKYFVNHSFNENIRTYTEEDFRDLCQEFLIKGKSPEILERKVKHNLLFNSPPNHLLQQSN